MHKKRYKKLRRLVCSAKQNPYRPYEAHAQTDQGSNRIHSGDYILESEKSRNEYEQEKHAQEMAQLLDLILQLQMELEKNRIAVCKHRKEILSMQKHIKQLRKKTNDSCERLTILSKQVKKEQTSRKDLSKVMKQIEHILAHISFLAGLCPASDSLNNISHAWRKETKRGNGYLNKRHIQLIDADYEEVK